MTVTAANRKGVRIKDLDHSRSLASLASTYSMDSEGMWGEGGFKKTKEIDEFDIRNDLVAWRLPGNGLLM